MTKAELKILEKAWEMEVRSAISKFPSHLIQTKSKLAKKLVSEGYLDKGKTVLGNLTIEGYELTHLGRITYCETCDEVQK